MLTLRREQVAALDTRLFEHWLASHVSRFFPSLNQHLNDAEVLEFVRFAMARARYYGFSDNTQITRFADVMLLLGLDFAEDSALPWAAEILHSVEPATVRSERLVQAAERHVWGDAPVGVTT